LNTKEEEILKMLNDRLEIVEAARRNRSAENLNAVRFGKGDIKIEPLPNRFSLLFQEGGSMIWEENMAVLMLRASGFIV
jgi:hypothetical protein